MGKNFKDIKHLVFDFDPIVYRVGFAVEKKRYRIDDGIIDPPVEFESKKALNKWIKDNELHVEDEYIWCEHTVEPVENALYLLKNCINGVLEKFGNPTYEGYLSDGPGFRAKIASIRPYKGNRDPSHKPKHYGELREYAQRKFGAVVVSEIEADDAVCIALSKHPERRCAISNDKDIIGLKGWSYDWTHPEIPPTWTSPRDGVLNFWSQVLSGDPTDNVEGIEGIGPKGAREYQEDAQSPEEAEKIVWGLYLQHYGGKAKERFLEMSRLIYILRTEEELENVKRGIYWTPKIKLE